MIDLLNIDSNTEINLILTDGMTEYLITTVLNEVEYAPNRTPFLVDLVVKNTDDCLKFPIGSKLIFGLDDFTENEYYKFILHSPTKLEPNKTLHYNMKIEFMN